MFASFRLSKRKKFVLVTLILTLFFWVIHLVSTENRYKLILGLSTTAYFLTAWALKDELGGVEWLTLLSLPALYSAAVALFYFLLPVRLLTRLPVALLYALGMYALLLTENIYNVAAERSIQLVRAARSIGLLITLITAFLFFNVLFAFHLSAVANAAVVMVIVFPLTIQALWSITLEEKRIDLFIWLFSFTTSLVMGEVTYLLSFWPIVGTTFSLLLSVFLYALIVLGQHWLMDRLFPSVIREVAILTSFVLILVLFATRWGE